MKSDAYPLRLILELEGVLMDIRPCFWEAYTRAAAAAGAARRTPDDFWRLVRTGAVAGQLISAAGARQVERFGGAFTEALESDDCLSACRPLPGIRAQLSGLGRPAERVLVTCGRNRAARHILLEAHDLSALFLEMAGLSEDARRRGAELQALTAGHRRTVVLAASAELVRSASLAGLIVIGCARGAATPRRLTQSGAAWVISDLQQLIDDIAGGEAQLRSIGLPLPPRD